MYFHALFWPALLMAAKIRVPDKLFVHGFLTVNGQKMSKSKGTFIMAETYLKHLDPQFIRYYYASKLSGDIGDIELNTEDFVSRVNSDLVGKLANLASRSGPMLSQKLGGRLAVLDEKGRALADELAAAKDEITADYESLNFASVVRRITALADVCNRFVDEVRPWATLKTDPEGTRTNLTAVLNAVRILTIYLKPILPVFARNVEAFLDIPPLTFADVKTVIENKPIKDYIRLVERVEKEKVYAMIEDSKPQAAQTTQQLDEPIAPECTIEDFAKVDLRIARISKAQPVDGADKLLALELDLGALKKNVFAGIAKAYKPEDLIGRLVVCVANLKPRKMKFGLSDGMVCASGPGGENVFLLTVDSGGRPGQRVH
jgi:methionyl-tRNA synthetase